LAEHFERLLDKIADSFRARHIPLLCPVIDASGQLWRKTHTD
jgi:hypothetical protein